MMTVLERLAHITAGLVNLTNHAALSIPTVCLHTDIRVTRQTLDTRERSRRSLYAIMNQPAASSSNRYKTASQSEPFPSSIPMPLPSSPHFHPVIIHHLSRAISKSSPPKMPRAQTDHNITFPKRKKKGKNRKGHDYASSCHAANDPLPQPMPACPQEAPSIAS